jgi:predicted GNAT family acetyltransferase
MASRAREARTIANQTPPLTHQRIPVIRQEQASPTSRASSHTAVTDTGVRWAPDLAGQVVDNPSRSRFELSTKGTTAFLLYRRTNTALTLIHTEVPVALHGLHVGAAFIEAARRSARSDGLPLVSECPYARAYLRRQR